MPREDRPSQLPPLTGPVACPADNGSQILAVLSYPGGRAVHISVSLTGCASASNGSINRSAAGIGTPRPFGPALLALLERLVSTRAQSDPGSAGALARGHWSVLSRSPLGRRYGATFLWDGRELIELGGSAGGRLDGAPSDSGAAYDPRTRRWRRIASAPAAVLPADAASVWTGRRVFVFGGPTLPGERASDVAGLYDPATNRWTVTGRAPVGPFNRPSAVWTGSRVIVAGIARGTPRLQVAAYDPASGRWSALEPPISPRHRPMSLAIVATDHGVLLWSLWATTSKTGPHTFSTSSGVDVFRLGAPGTWTNVTGSWPQQLAVDEPTFTGTRVLLAPSRIWCGPCGLLASDTHGYLLDPRALRLTSIAPGPLDDLEPQIIWTGAAEISLNAAGEISGPHVSVLPGNIAFWNPATGGWTRGPRAPRPIGDEPAVWAHRALYALAADGSLLAFGR